MPAIKNVLTIQENGKVTLPDEFQQRYGLKKGDTLVFQITRKGLLLKTKETEIDRLFDELGDALKAQGVSLDELIESGRHIRGEIIQEKYGLAIDR